MAGWFGLVFILSSQRPSALPPGALPAHAARTPIREESAAVAFMACSPSCLWRAYPVPYIPFVFAFPVSPSLPPTQLSFSWLEAREGGGAEEGVPACQPPPGHPQQEMEGFGEQEGSRLTESPSSLKNLPSSPSLPRVLFCLGHI